MVQCKHQVAVIKFKALLPALHPDAAGTYVYQHIFLTPDAVSATPRMGAGEWVIYWAAMESLTTSLKAVI